MNNQNQSTYTSPYGTTQQGSNLQGFTDALNSITNSTQPIPQQAVNQATAASLSKQQGYAPFMQQAQTQLTQQAGIPQLQQQYGNLSQIFQMYLADQNLAQKYSSSQNMNPYANQNLMNAAQTAYQASPYASTLGASTVANPYLASPSQIIAAMSQPQGQGFQGFTIPSLNTGAMGVVPNAANNILNLLQGAVGGESNLVNSALGEASGNYQSALSALSNLASIFEQERQNQLAEQQSGVLGTQDVQALRDSITQDAQQGTTFTDLVNKYRPMGVDANSILQIYMSTGYYKDANGNPLPLVESPDYLASIGIPSATIKQVTPQANQKAPKVITDAQGNKYFQDPVTGSITPWSQKSAGNPLSSAMNWVQSLFQSPASQTQQTISNLKAKGWGDAQINEYLQMKGLS